MACTDCEWETGNYEAGFTAAFRNTLSEGQREGCQRESGEDKQREVRAHRAEQKKPHADAHCGEDS